MKKYGFLMALVIALTVMLVIGCMEPVDSYTPAPGMGAVQVSFGADDNARGVYLPSSVAVESFPEFLLDFTVKAASPGTAKQVTVVRTTDMTGNNLTTPVELVVGTYNLTVYAFGTVGDSSNLDNARAKGTYTVASAPGDIVIQDTITNSAISVELTAIIDGLLNGTFSWNISNTIAIHPVTAASVTIVPVNTVFTGGGFPGVAPTSPTSQLSGTPGGTTWTSAAPVSVRSGYYFADFTIAANGVTKVFRHMVHIYQNMNSPITGLTFTDDHFGFVPPTTGEQPAGITYVHPENNDLILTPDDAAAPGATGAGTVGSPIALVAGDVLVITVDNPSLTEIIWNMDGTPLTGTFLTGTPVGQTLTITHGSSFFSAGRHYLNATARNGSTLLGFDDEDIWIEIK